MSEQALDLKRSVHIVRRHKILVGAFILLGLLAGVGYGLFKPPMLTSSALVGLPPSTRDTFNSGRDREQQSRAGGCSAQCPSLYTASYAA